MNRLIDSPVMVPEQNISDTHPGIDVRFGEEVLRVNSVKLSKINDVSFSVRKGEVLGIAGNEVSGKSQLCRLIMGLEPCSDGKISYKNNQISGLTTGQIMLRGVFYLSNAHAIKDTNLASHSITNMQVNLILCNQKNRSKWITWTQSENSDQSDFCSDYQPETVSKLLVNNPRFSLFGKCYSADAGLLIVEEPTVDMNSSTRSAFYNLVKNLSESGKAVIIFSSDIPELINLSHRLLVMNEGEITVELTPNEITQDTILKLIHDGNHEIEI